MLSSRQAVRLSGMLESPNLIEHGRIERVAVALNQIRRDVRSREERIAGLNRAGIAGGILV